MTDHQAALASFTQSLSQAATAEQAYDSLTALFQ